MIIDRCPEKRYINGRSSVKQEGQRVSMKGNKLKVFIIVTAAVIIADHLTKWIIKTSMDLHQTIRVIGEYFTITYILNSGIAFGLFDSNPSPHKSVLLIIISFIALGIILYIFLSLPKSVKHTGLAMGLIFGGAIGNMIDRIVRGRVVDFLDIDFPDITIRALNIHMTRWPTFNLADSCVLAGIVLLLVIILRHGGEPEPRGNE